MTAVSPLGGQLTQNELRLSPVPSARTHHHSDLDLPVLLVAGWCVSGLRHIIDFWFAFKMFL